MPLVQTINKVVNAKEIFLRKIKSSIPLNMQMIREQNNLLLTWKKFSWSPDSGAHIKIQHKLYNFMGFIISLAG